MNLAEMLLDAEAVRIRPHEPFTWASGWKSPFYCDNRKLISHPDIRNYIKVKIANLILEKYPDCDAIAGVATGAIPISAIVADMLGLPLVYIRSSKKDHGTQNLIEGEIFPDYNYVIIEDLVSTGGSSIKALEALREKDVNVLGMIALFTYGFPQSVKAFKDADCELLTITNYEELSKVAIDGGYISPEDESVLNDWRQHPDTWQAPIQ